MLTFRFLIQVPHIEVGSPIEYASHRILQGTAERVRDQVQLGQIAREGQGLAFFYLKYKTQVVVVPTSSMDANLVFNEVTSSFQTVTIQGQFTYRVHNPKRVAELLNYTMEPVTHTHISDDPDRLAQRITNIIQMETRGEIQQRRLEEVLTQYETIAGRVLERVKNSSLLDPLGVDLLSVYFVAAKPTPEVAKASRPNTARRCCASLIWPSPPAAQQRSRKSGRSRKMSLTPRLRWNSSAGSSSIFQGDNALREAGNKGKALEEEAAYQNRVKQKDLDLYSGIDPRKVLALAMAELGQNANQIGNLTITSEILAALLDGRAVASLSSNQG